MSDDAQFRWWDGGVEWFTQPMRKLTLPKGTVTTPGVMGLLWAGITNQELIWGGIMKTQYLTPVRQNVPQYIEYTFKDENGLAISLADYASVYLEVKQQGSTFSVVNATIENVSGGIVNYPAYVFVGLGVWQAQFYTVSGLGLRLYGEPIQFTVVPNVDDLELPQLMTY